MDKYDKSEIFLFILVLALVIFSGGLGAWFKLPAMLEFFKYSGTAFISAFSTYLKVKK